MLKELVHRNLTRKEYITYETSIFDGEAYITFDACYHYPEKMELTVAITNRGAITIQTMYLQEDTNGVYFEYGPEYTRIYLDDFEELNDFED